MARRTQPATETAEPVAAPLLADDPQHPTVAYACRMSLSYIREEDGHNPRTDYGEADGSFAALVESIRQRGVLQSILVQGSTTEQQVQVIAGHRRVAACRALGLDFVPAIVLNRMDSGQAVALALAENLQRRDLNPLEEAEGFQRLESLGWSQEAIGRTVGRSQPHVSRALSLLSLPTGTRTMLREGLLSASHGAELVRLLGTARGGEYIDFLAGKAIEYGWSVSALRVSVAAELRDMDEDRAAAQTAIPLGDEPAPAREYATPHKSPTSAGTERNGHGPDALAGPADTASEVKPGYTPADAKAEFAASQQPDPDETTPVQDAMRAAKGQEGHASAEGWYLRYQLDPDDHADLLAAGYAIDPESEDEQRRIDIDAVIRDAILYRAMRGHTVEFAVEQVEALKTVAAGIEAKKQAALGAGYLYGYNWEDYVDTLVSSAVAGRPIIAPEAQELLGKIAAHYHQPPADYLLAMLTARAQSLGLAGGQEGQVSA